ncbi:MAG: addiction module protein [Pirellulaceae bacterium]|nr:addiction module protein [Pirellulaceae bacterium]
MSIIDDLRLLPPEKKLEIVTQLWDDLATSKLQLTLPSEELAEMDRRREELRSDASLAIDADEMWRQVDGD